MNSRTVLRLLCLTALLLEIGCSGDAPVAGTEIRNGNCVGTIYNSDGSIAQGAVVRLIPGDYDPTASSAPPVDSTFTDAYGNYGFTVTESNYYNITAEKGTESCMQDSVPVQTGTQTIVDNDTLRESGWLSGTIQLKPGDDGRKAVVLVLGTSFYFVPLDTSGTFTSPLLPQGSYTVRIFTTQPGYTVFDTVVVIGEGAETRLSVTLPSSNAPSITRLSATYDSAAMFVTLTWPIPDTSKFISYAIYRKSARGNDTMLVIDKSAATYYDDVVRFDGDSVSYAIAAIGKNYKEGYRTVTQTIVICGKVHFVKKIDLTTISASLHKIESISIFSDRADELFVVGQDVIYKLDSNGIVQKDYQLSVPGGTLRGNLERDHAGNLIILAASQEPRTQATLRFDDDLNMIAEMNRDTTNPFFSMLSINGTFITFGEDYDANPPTHCSDLTTYDSTGALINSYHSANYIQDVTLFGDTIVTYECSAGSGPYTEEIHYYALTLQPLFVFKVADFIRYTGNISYLEGNEPSVAFSNGLFTLSTSTLNKGDGSYSTLSIFTDSKGTFLARCILPASPVYPDPSGHLYCVEYEPWNSNNWKPIPKTLYKYTMAPPFSPKTP